MLIAFALQDHFPFIKAKETNMKKFLVLAAVLAAAGLNWFMFLIRLGFKGVVR